MADHPKIKKRFAEVLRPLNEQELSALEQELLACGEVRDPIVTWKGFVADGHNRLQLAKKHELDYCKEVLPSEKYPTEDSVVAWIIDQQLARRNLNPQNYSFYRGKRYNEAPSGQGKSDGPTKSEIAEQLAKAAGVSPATIRNDAATAKAVDGLGKSLKQKYLADEIKLTKAELDKLASLKPAQQRKIELGVAKGEYQPQGKRSAWSVALGVTSAAKPKPKPKEKPPKAFDPAEVAEAFQHLTKMVDAMHGARPDKAKRDFIQGKLKDAYDLFKEWAK